MSQRGKIVIVAGPSGSGKSTLITKFLKEHSEYIFPTSATTRKARPGETNGVQYHFITTEEFENSIENDGFLEWALVYDHYYGTLKSTVQIGLNEGKHFLKDIDIQGAKSLMNLLDKNDLKSIFISPPSLDLLKERLLARPKEDGANIETRISEAKKEMEGAYLFDINIINDNLEEAYESFKNFILTS